MRLFIVCSILICLPALVYSGGLPDSLLDPVKSISFKYENDFFTATDRYYTQGIKLESTGKWWKKSPFSFLLIRNKHKGIHQYGISAEQNCFTPRSIRVDSIYRGERPYAAVFLLSHFLRVSFHASRQQLTTKLDLGVIGPCVMCEEEQKGIHHALNNIQPLGWEYQVATDYIINYSIQYEKTYLERKYMDASWGSRLRLGSLYTDVATQVMLRAGKIELRFSTPTDKFYAFIFVSSSVRYVLYNATLQGGLLNKNSVNTLPASSISRAVLQSTTGIRLTYKKFSIDYFYNWVSPEFDNGLSHAWGGLDFSVRF